MNTKNKVLLIVILIIAIAGIGVCGFFLGKSFNDVSVKEDEKIVENEESKENESTDEKKEEVKEEKTYTYEDVTGVYKFFEKGTDGDMDREITYSLSEDGLYQEYNLSGMAWGTLGNYVIDGNKIILHKYFFTGSDITVGYVEQKEYIEVEINEDKSLTLVEKDGNKIKLEKTNEKCPEDIFSPVGAYIKDLEDQIEGTGIYAEN